MQLKQELHNVQRKSLNINDYSMNVKKLQIHLLLLVQWLMTRTMFVILNGLNREFHLFWTSIVVQETFLDFQELVAFFISGAKEQN